MLICNHEDAMKRFPRIFLAIAVLCFLSCAASNPPSGPDPVTVPSSLKAVGSLGRIDLSWSPVTIDGLVHYNVYRETDGADFSLLASATGTSYADMISSPGGDGVMYSYRVTAVADKEYEPSETVQQMHGTRFPAVYDGAGVFETAVGQSPYVVEGESFIQNDLTVGANTSLFILPGAALSVLEGCEMTVGPGVELQSLGTPANPATIACRQLNGNDAVGSACVWIQFGLVKPWNPATKRGTMLKFTGMRNILMLDFFGTDALFDNCYITGGNGSDANLRIRMSSDLEFTHCLLTEILLEVACDQSGTGFSFTNNRVRCPDRGIAMVFSTITSGQVLGSGQVTQNDMDGSHHIAINDNTDPAVLIPLGGNYWAGGTGNPPVPAVQRFGGAQANVDFTTPLSSAPASAGPEW